MEALSLFLLIIISFLASIIGAMIGMAMIIMLPTMIFFGIPVHSAIATGRFSMVGGSIGSIGKLSRNANIKPKYFAVFAAAGAIGSLIGASYLTNFSEESLKIVIGIFMIIVSVLVLCEDYLKTNKSSGDVSLKLHILSSLGGLFVGSYIGIVGGGGATIVIFLLILIYGLNFHDAVANQKAITLPVSIIATIVFVYQGLVDYKIGIPLFVANMIGGYTGAAIILKFSHKWLKRILVPITVAMAIKLVFF